MAVIGCNGRCLSFNVLKFKLFLKFMWHHQVRCSKVGFKFALSHSDRSLQYSCFYHCTFLEVIWWLSRSRAKLFSEILLEHTAEVALSLFCSFVV